MSLSASRHKQFCPLAMASDVLSGRWTMMLLGELLRGTSRFNDLRRGLPRMSPALLSKRLKELEAAGLVMRSGPAGTADTVDYILTDAGLAVEPIVDAMGDWGHRWVTTQATMEHLDVRLLMWNLRRNLKTDPIPPGRSVVQFVYHDLPVDTRNWWLLVEPGRDTDLCSVEPGYDVDLYVNTDLRTMTEVWMGYAPAGRAIEDGRLLLVGNRALEATFQIWLGSSRYAGREKCVA